MKGQVILILLYAVSFSFSFTTQDIEEEQLALNDSEDPAEELELLLENVSDEDKKHSNIVVECRDISLYWCRGYISRCSYPVVYSNCPRTCNRCHGAGGWSPWSAYGACSKTCYYGYQTRSRKCSSPSYTACQGPSVERQRCNELVSCSGVRMGSMAALTSGAGTWTPWGSYSKCSKSCGTGLQSRNRTCVNPSQPLGHKRCPGPFRQHRPCNQNPCPVDGGWSSWGPFHQCSKSCGGGSQYKHRKCKNPPPKHGGKLCQGPVTLSRECNTQACAVDGDWSPWGSFGLCSRTCGGGIQYRSRACNNPAPSSGGKNCAGQSRQSNSCNTQACADDGDWSPWSAVGPCSRSCGGGTQYRTRACNNPASSSGGRNCVGPSHQSNSCNTQTCAVDGDWSPWSAVGPCSRSCGGGTQYRSRACNNPAPSSGGRNCVGPSHDSNSCNTQACAVDGDWSLWSAVGPCSRSCGGGTQYRSRACNNPAPSSGGRNCVGPSHQSNSCNTQACAVDGDWSPWGAVEPCSRSCGGGTQYRTRACNNPAPSSGGNNCVGPSHQSDSCNTQACAVDGEWSPWSAVGPCSRSCGGGTQYRTRACNNPAPSSGGNNCVGPSHQSNSCNTQACAVDGNWSPWGAVGPCSKSCGGGTQYRSRACNNPAPSSGGKCSGPSQQSSTCNTQACAAADGQWSQWSVFGSCSKTCGGGIKYRTRKCDNPAPGSGGQNCQGESYQSVACQIQNCPVYGGWSSWGPYSSCSRTCGSGGWQTRQRTCTNPASSFGGRQCHGYSRQTRICGRVPCPQTSNSCRDTQSYAFCRYAMMSYRCGEYYIYCRKTCNACNYSIPVNAY